MKNLVLWRTDMGIEINYDHIECQVRLEVQMVDSSDFLVLCVLWVCSYICDVCNHDANLITTSLSLLLWSGYFSDLIPK